MNRDSFPTAVRQPFHRIKHHIVCRQLGNRPVSAMLHYPTRKSNKRRLNQRLQSATMGGILKTMGLNYKHTIIGTALALSVTAILACGGSAPAAQPAPTAPTATQAPAATATTAPVVARVDTPAPPIFDSGPNTHSDTRNSRTDICASDTTNRSRSRCTDRGIAHGAAPASTCEHANSYAPTA